MEKVNLYISTTASDASEMARQYGFGIEIAEYCTAWNMDEKFAGVDGVVVHEREELRTALETALADKEIGILLLTEKFGREFPEIVDEVKLHHKVPLIVEIPDRHGTGRKPDFITSYVNEAIGLKL